MAKFIETLEKGGIKLLLNIDTIVSVHRNGKGVTVLTSSNTQIELPEINYETIRRLLEMVDF